MSKKETSEKEYGDLFYLELQEIIPKARKMTVQQREFVNSYMSKLGIDIEENPLIIISPMDSKIFGLMILSVIVEYEKQLNLSNHCK